MSSFNLNYYFLSALHFLVPQDAFYLLENKKIDNKTRINYLKYLFSRYNGIKLKNNKFKNILSLTYHFIPFPNMFIVSHLTDLPEHRVSKRMNTYIYTGNKIGQDRIIPGNRSLPHYSTSPIPFTYSYVKPNGKRVITLSYTYYFELRIDNHWTKPPLSNQCVSIGFGEKYTPTISKQVGWAANTIGYHSDDGSIYIGSANPNLKGKKWGPGDIVGAGINYLTKNKMEIFFTLNGKVISKIVKCFERALVPLIGLDTTYRIHTNLGIFPFRYDPLKNRDLSHNNIISSKNLALIKGYNFVYEYSQPKINIINIKKGTKFCTLAEFNEIIQNKIENNPIIKNIIKNPFDLPKVLDKWENFVQTTFDSETPLLDDEEQITAESEDDSSADSSEESSSSEESIIVD